MDSLLTEAMCCNSALLPVASEKGYIFVLFCYTHTRVVYQLEFVLLHPSCKEKDDSLLVLGQTRVSQVNPFVALFLVALNDALGNAFSLTGNLTAYMERWPSLRRDQGITRNPPDRCHMHARAHKHTEKQTWLGEREPETQGGIK